MAGEWRDGKTSICICSEMQRVLPLFRGQSSILGIDKPCLRRFRAFSILQTYSTDAKCHYLGQKGESSAQLPSVMFNVIQGANARLPSGISGTHTHHLKNFHRIEHLPIDGIFIRTYPVDISLGIKDVRTGMIYTHA